MKVPIQQFLPIVGLCCFLIFGCNKKAHHIPEPDYNPHVLKPGKYVPAKARVINMDSVAKPKYIIPEVTHIKVGKPTFIPEPTNDFTVSPPTYHIIEGKVINMDSVSKPKYVPSEGKSTHATWPERIPARPTDNERTPLHVRYFNNESGLNFNGANCFLEDSYGRIWIGLMRGGVAVWDGTELYHLTVMEGLINDEINSLLEDRKGRIWIGTDAGLCVWDEGGFTIYTVDEGLTNNMILSLLEDRKGNIWIGTANGLNTWDGSGFTHYTSAEGLANNHVFKLFEDSKGNIWIGGRTQSVWDGHTFTHYRELSGSAKFEDVEGNIWFAMTGGDYGGVKVWDGEGFKHYSIRVWDLLMDRENRVWIAGSGVTVMEGGGFKRYGMDDGITGSFSHLLMEDRNGNIWVGTTAGMCIIPGDGIKRYTDTAFHDLLQASLYEDSRERIWMSARGLYAWQGVDGSNSRAGFSFYSETWNLGSITHVIEDRLGRMWLAGLGTLLKWDSAGITSHSIKHEVGTRFLWAPLIDRNGNIWCGIGATGLCIWDGTGFTLYTTEQGLSSNGASGIFEDSRGNIWIGSMDNGITLWDGKGFSHFNTDNGLNCDAVGMAIMEDIDGRIWFSSYGGGVNVWDGNGFMYYTVEEGLSSNQVNNIYRDKSGDIWLGTIKGMDRIRKNGESLVIDHFSKEEGLTPTAAHGILMDRHDQLWVSTFGGLKRMNSNLIEPDETRPEISIQSLNLFYDHQDWRKISDGIFDDEDQWSEEQKRIFSKVKFDSVLAFRNLPSDPSFPFNINELSLKWQGIHWSAPHKLQYSYLLEGKDEYWSPLVKENKITYHDLRPGNYTFKVRAVGGNGKWGNTASYAFIIRPPVWLTMAAKAAYVFFVLFFFYLYFIWRTAAQRKKIAFQKKELTRERQVSERLQHVDKLKDQFLANTSHELRTPLQGIIGISESLYDQAAKLKPAELRENLAMTISSGKRLNSLVNDILDFSKLRNFDIELQRKPVNVRVLADIVLRNNAFLVQGQDITLINNIGEDLPAVDGDENRLQQIMYNIIGNAIKFTASGHVKVGATQKGQLIELFVEDTGMGIPENRQEAVFQDFEQADSSISREFAGTGLGLTISKRLVELHGGALWLESQEGKGSTFYFTIPVSDKKAAVPDVVSDLSRIHPTADSDGNKLKTGNGMPTEEHSDIARILIVDDEPINQQVFKNHLSHENLQLSQAMNGEAAMRMIDTESPFDLVVLDIMMPRMSGYEVCQQIREKYMASELPVVMVTAKNQVEDLVEGLAQGANDYISKPFTKDEFIARVKTQLDIHRINKVTGKFVPGAFLKSLGRDRITEVMLGDQVELEVTVLFSDIRDYTTLAETMTPKENFNFINGYNQRIGPVIQQNNGFINQYLGDGNMAIFPDHPVDALKAAIELQKAVIYYNEERENQHRKAISIGLGMHTGDLIMGIIGDEQRMDAATIADTVNTASRIESLTKYYGANILLSEATAERCKNEDGSFQPFRFMGHVQVKGKEKPVRIYECFEGDEEKVCALKLKTLPEFEGGMAHFYAKEFPEASAVFSKVIKMNPKDHVARLFMTKSAKYTVEGVPDVWTGMEVMKSK